VYQLPPDNPKDRARELLRAAAQLAAAPSFDDDWFLARVAAYVQVQAEQLLDACAATA
jgi:hypothetical protein